MKKPRILVADDHPLILKAICGLLEDGVGEVVGAVTDGQALVDAAQWLEPDIILADISMRRLNGLEATRALQYAVPQSKVIILTGHHEPAYVTLAFELGARGYLLKRTPLHAELSRAIPHVLAGNCYIGYGVRAREERAFADGGESVSRPRL
jgi:DNA-binding NarL/FixJ family response regulator